MELLIVMTIIVLISSIGFASYTAFLETTQYNQDVANLQHDILIMQRASMLLDRDPSDGWVYGVGIDFRDIDNGKYYFFKWCSGFDDFGLPATRGEFPNYTESSGDDHDGNMPAPPQYNFASNCSSNPAWPDSGWLAHLSGYNVGTLNMVGDVGIDSNISFLLFESVSGRMFFYRTNGDRVPIDEDLEIKFNRRITTDRILLVKNLTGRTEIVEVEDD